MFYKIHDPDRLESRPAYLDTHIPAEVGSHGWAARENSQNSSDIDARFAGLAGKRLMTSETDDLRAELHALMASPAIGLPAYGDDPAIKRRVGFMIVKCAEAKHRSELSAKIEAPSQ